MAGSGGEGGAQCWHGHRTGTDPRLVAEGQPARLLGLIDPTSAFWEAAQETGALVVHVLAAGDRALAERFGEIRPPIRSPFERLKVAESPWGLVLGGAAHLRPAAWPNQRRSATPSWSRV